jgi:hypothetical protein
MGGVLANLVRAGRQQPQRIPLRVAVSTFTHLWALSLTPRAFAA